MKKIILMVMAITFGLSLLSGQNNCSKYYPMIEGSSFEYTNTDKKGKSEGVTSYTISKVSQEGSATNATFDLKLIDKKGKEVFNTNYIISCDGGVVRIDYESLLPSQMMQQYTEMGVEMDISGTDIQLPNDLTVGQDLEDANIDVGINMSGIKMNISVEMTDRKVMAKENVTTSAGTFDCYVIKETSITKLMGKNIETNSKMWLSEGVGMIKQESYKKNGDLTSSTELSKYSR